MIRLAILEETARALRNELLRDDSVEQGGFLPTTSGERT